MRWDGKAYADIVKQRVYAVLFPTEIPQAATMGNKEYADFLRSHHHDLGIYCPDKKTPDVRANTSGIKIIFKDRYLNNAGDNSIELTWSMAARHIRAWEYEKAHPQQENAPQNTLNTAQKWEQTHLCGDYHGKHCKFLIQAKENTVMNGKKLDSWCPYCTSEGKVRKIGSAGLWTGISPKFCPKRKAAEQNTEEPTEDDITLFERYQVCFGRYCRFDKAYGADNKYTKRHYEEVQKIYGEIVTKGLEQAYKKWREEKHQPIEQEETMARKLQLDAAITKDIKSAASDSFIDNIKMIDIKEIIPSEKNFYEMSGIDLLADDIEREGLKHNLVVAKDPATGLYEVKSGHRRLAAIERLVAENRLNKNVKLPCIVDGDKTEAENNFDLIMLNATQRKYSDADVMKEYEGIERSLKALADEGKPVKGRMRDNIAKILKVSPAQVGKIENIKHNAVPEVEKAVKGGAMSISTANEIAKLPEEKQKEIIKEKPNISHTEVKELQKQEKKPAAPKITKNDDFDDDLDELDELLDDEDLNEERESKSEKKSSLTFSLILSEDEARALLELINDNIVYMDNDDELIPIRSRLEDFVG